MTAKADNGFSPESRWKFQQFTLASGNHAWQGGACCIDLGTGKVVPGDSGATDLLYIGTFAEEMDATSADKLVNVDLIEEIVVRWFVNSGSGAVAATDIGRECYFDDDQTVTMTSTSNSLAGRVWAVDATKGVAVQKMTAPLGDTLLPALAQEIAAPAFASNDSIPADIVNGAVYAIPNTGAASTVTLPAAAADGTVAYFAANGTANGHTVQYRDATGPTNLTTALTASKRHLVVVSKTGGKWFANAYVSP